MPVRFKDLAIDTRAWKALESRLGVDQARAVAPVLVRLTGRLRAAAAITRYGSMFSELRCQPLWSALLNHVDRGSRRWAFTAALRGGLAPKRPGTFCVPKRISGGGSTCRCSGGLRRRSRDGTAIGVTACYVS